MAILELAAVKLVASGQLALLGTRMFDGYSLLCLLLPRLQLARAFSLLIGLSYLGAN